MLVGGDRPGGNEEPPARGKGASVVGSSAGSGQRLRERWGS